MRRIYLVSARHTQRTQILSSRKTSRRNWAIFKCMFLWHAFIIYRRQGKCLNKNAWTLFGLVGRKFHFVYNNKFLFSSSWYLEIKLRTFLSNAVTLHIFLSKQRGFFLQTQAMFNQKKTRQIDENRYCNECKTFCLFI